MEHGSRSQSDWQFSWTNKRFRGFVLQAIAVLCVGLAIAWLWRNTVYNLDARRISTGFDFLRREAGMPIADALIAYSPTDSYSKALFVGLLNTLRVAVIGIALATILGTFIGIARLSKNWLLAKAAAIYIEVLRDLPLLLQIFIWYALWQLLPANRQALNPMPGLFLSNRGLFLPSYNWTNAHGWVALALVAGVVASLVTSRLLLNRQMADGKSRRSWPFSLAFVFGLPIVTSFALGVDWTLTWPTLKGFNFAGGTTLSPEYVALLVALVTYTAAFIAEIVRAGILAVTKGQWEAGSALGLPRRTALRQIVLPQALRVIIPPLTSQYLNLTKNSSLAVAIGYQDIVSIANTTLNQTGQAIEAIALIMAVFLSVSLSISVLMNWYNARIALVER